MSTNHVHVHLHARAHDVREMHVCADADAYDVNVASNGARVKHTETFEQAPHLSNVEVAQSYSSCMPVIPSFDKPSPHCHTAREVPNACLIGPNAG